MLGPDSNGMGDHLRAVKPPRYVTSHSGQLILLPSVGQKMSIGQSAVTFCGRGRRGRYGYLWINVWVAGKSV